MARFKNYLLVILGFAIAGAIGVAFSAGTARAVVATLVEVVNPSTSPVATSTVNVTDPGRIGYQSELDTGSCVHSFGCILSFPIVPTGHRVVVQHTTGFGGFNSTPTSVTATVLTGNSVLAALFPPFTSSSARLFFAQPVLFYVDSGSSATVDIESDVEFVGQGAVTLIGYELDCTVAACAPIAAQ